jgi:hypothetical protein
MASVASFLLGITSVHCEASQGNPGVRFRVQEANGCGVYISSLVREFLSRSLTGGIWASFRL